MNAQWGFYALASGLSGLVVWALLRGVWRALPLQPDGAAARRQALCGPVGLAVGMLIVVSSLYGLRGNLDALGDERAERSEQWLLQGLPAPGAKADVLYQGLQRHLQKQPSDPRALVLKARLDMQASRFVPAVAAYQAAVAGRSKAVNDAAVWVEYAEALAMVQGRSLLGEPQRLLHKALELDRHHFQALDLAGSAAWEQGDYASAVGLWKRLLARLPPGSPQHGELQRAIERAEQRLRFALPTRP